MRRRHATVVRYDRRELLPGSPMAGYMWPEWNRPQPREVRLRDGGQILKLANHIAVDRWRHRSHQPLTSRVRNVRDARRARIGRRSRVHLYRDQGVLAPMGRTPPHIIGSLPSQQLSCRDWSKDDETTHHRQHRSEGRTGH